MLPREMESSRENLREIRKKEVLLFLPFIATIAAMVALLVVAGLLAGTTTKANPSDEPYFPAISAGEGFLVLLPYTSCFLLLLAYQIFYRPIHSRAMFRDYVGRAVRDLRDPEAMKFREALDAVSIAVGIEPPRLVFLVNDSRANAMAFIAAGGQPTVGVTTGMLKAALPVDEATAVMAHELAHLQLKVNVNPPRLFQPEFMPNLLLLCYFLTGYSLFFVRMSSGTKVLMILIYLVMLVMLVALRFSSFFNARMTDLLYLHGDLLADSVAVKLSRDPDALRRVIERVHDINRGQGYDLQQAYFVKYLFLPPASTIGDYYRYAGTILAGRLGSSTFYAEKMAMSDIVGVEQRFFKERMTNLDFITQGSVRSISDWE